MHCKPPGGCDNHFCFLCEDPYDSRTHPCPLFGGVRKNE